MADPRPATPELEGFVRKTLGCACAPEVFQRVEDDRCPLPGLKEPARRIACGGRLLVYLAALPDPAAAVERIGDWVTVGVAERDRRGMNRLRLVLGCDALPPAAVQVLETAFARVAGRDERVHLHLIPATALTSF